MNELPTRADYANAILSYWKGGGTTQLIIDICREDMATLDEAAALGERLARRASTGSGYVNRDICKEQLEAVRASAALLKKNPKIQEPVFDTYQCFFSDTFECPQCSELYGELIKHGHLLAPEELAANVGELKQYLGDLGRESRDPGALRG